MKKKRFQLINDNWPVVISAFLIILLMFVIFSVGQRANAYYFQLPSKLIIYAFSTQEEVFSEGILPAFEHAWESESGQELEIEIVFGPSATLAGEINLGAPADIVIFSNAHHVNWLKIGHKVDMDAQPIVIGQSPMVIVTRPGNPHEIHNFADLTQADLCLLHADPKTSGAGEWAVLAAYGSALREKGSEDAARQQLQGIWNNVKLLGASARATLVMFEMGVGDAFITYEQDALLAQQRGIPMELIYPPHTIIAQHIAVPVDDNVILRELPVVEAFMEYLVSDSAQQVLGNFSMRRANNVGEHFQPISDPFTVEDLGGWPNAYTELVEKYWQQEIEPRLDLTPTSLLINSDN